MPTPQASYPVLRLGRQTVEWFEPRASGPPLYGRATVDGLTAVDLVRAAREAVKAAGGKGGSCEVSLDTSLAPERLLTLPALAEKELAAVLRRKAAHLIDSDDDLERARFLAIRSGTASTEDDSVGERRRTRADWYMVALDAGLQRELALRLHQAGFRPKRLTSSALSLIASAASGFDGHEDAVLSIGVEESHTALHLIRGDRVLILDRIDGDLLMSTAVAAAVVQSARNCISSWRKRSRGEGIRGAILHGLSRERAGTLEQTLASTLQGVEVRVAPYPARGEDDPRAGRFQVLACAPLRTPLNPDLTPPQPPRRRSVVMAGAAGLLVAVGLGFGLSTRFSAMLSDIRGRKQVIAENIAQLHEREAELEQAQAELGTLAAKQQRLEALKRAGLPVDALLGEVVGAFAGHAEILELRVSPEPGGEGWSLSATGEAQADPLRLAAHLEALRASLLRSDSFDSVEIQLPDRLPSDSKLSFQVFAQVSS